MTKEELLSRLNGQEWNDFEVKEAKNEIPKNAWETVSAFSNSYGGWIVFGIKEKKSGRKIRLRDPGRRPYRENRTRLCQCVAFKHQIQSMSINVN